MPYLYVIANGELSKIGYTANLDKRLKEIQREFPTELKVIRKYEVDWALGLEAELHLLFRSHRVYKEWFDLGEDGLWKLDQYVKMRITQNGELILGESARKAMLADDGKYTDRVRKNDWIGKEGTTGCERLDSLVPPCNSHIGGLPVKVWWEWQGDSPRRCIQVFNP